MIGAEEKDCEDPVGEKESFAPAQKTGPQLSFQMSRGGIYSTDCVIHLFTSETSVGPSISTGVYCIPPPQKESWTPWLPTPHPNPCLFSPKQALTYFLCCRSTSSGYFPRMQLSLASLTQCVFEVHPYYIILISLHH